MKVLFFANKMPDLCGAFLHDIDLALELQTRGHQVVFLTVRIPREGVQGDTYRGFRFMHYSAASSFLETSSVWICPHAPVLPEVRRLNARGYHRPIITTCHYDGNYNTLRMNVGTQWVEMVCFINSIMEPNYRKNIVPWPSNIVRTDVVRPILHASKVLISEPFQGDAITLINANQNKGVHVFLEIARRMPQQKFLAVLPYYGELRVPPAPSNVEWVPFHDDIRTILRRTRVLVVPSYYESFGRVAMEAMANGIPVLYSKPNPNSVYPGGSTEGVASWIGDAAIAVDREVYDEWVERIRELEDDDVWTSWSQKAKTHVDSLHIFNEASRIAGVVEDFTRQHPVVIQTTEQKQKTASPQQAPRLTNNPQGPVGFGFSNGRLRIQR